SGLNAAIYHVTIYRKLDQWDRSPIPPLQARLAGGTSLILWAGVITMGRVLIVASVYPFLPGANAPGSAKRSRRMNPCTRDDSLVRAGAVTRDRLICSDY